MQVRIFPSASFVAAAVLFLMLLSVAEVHACTIPPASAYAPVSKLVARTNTIVLATALSSEYTIVDVRRLPSGVDAGRSAIKYTFSLDQSLKGTTPPTFSMTFYTWGGPTQGSPPNDIPDVDFDRHRDPHWKDRGGRMVGNQPDCEISPRFRIGARYLIFVERPWHILGFEQILSNDDFWLAEIRQLIATSAHDDTPK